MNNHPLIKLTTTIGEAAALDRYPCIRLYRYLADHNYSRFGSIDADTLQKFCLQDRHKTFKGKSPCLVIIRRFIIFLEDTGHIRNKHLHLSIDPGCAPGEKVVDVLTEEQCKRIEQYRECADSPIGLRRIAMVMTCIRMGLRASDVINLKLRDIDWHSRKYPLQGIPAPTVPAEFRDPSLLGSEDTQ